ncbi:hypothetical protein L345_06993, partial [Ophiophagus hannah]
MGNNTSHRNVKKNKPEKITDQEKTKERRGFVILLKKDQATVKVVLLPPLGKLSHGSKVLPLFSFPLGNRVNIYSRPELRGCRGDKTSPSCPFPSAARRGGGDCEMQKMQRLLTLFFLVEAEKSPADGDSAIAKNKIKHWYTIHPVGMKGQPGLYFLIQEIKGT